MTTTMTTMMMMMIMMMSRMRLLPPPVRDRHLCRICVDDAGGQLARTSTRRAVPGRAVSGVADDTDRLLILGDR